ncbi:MAG: phosphopentomutase [Fimbriimonas sp.]
MMRRAIVIVLDGCGAGAAPDFADYGDAPGASTLRHVWEASGGFCAPNLTKVGFLAAAGIANLQAPSQGQFGRLKPLSKGGKDSVTGHWEMMGITLDHPFPTYPNGFPLSLVREFEGAIGRDVIGNRAASGTEILDQLGPEHLATGKPILYTSADSVFQLAAHEEIVPIETLYEWCEIGRKLSDAQRVIARPFVGSPGAFRRTERRKDYPVTPPSNFVDEIGDVLGIGVVPELFSGRGFRRVHRTQNNAEHGRFLLESLSSEARFIFANFEDFDMLYGHRNNPLGFARCLEDFDEFLGDLGTKLTSEDLLILTADHGNDPTTVSTDHTREYIPFVQISASSTGIRLGDQDGFQHVGLAVKNWLSS